MVATIETPRKTERSQHLHLSHSQLRSYATCSLRWFLSRKYAPGFVGSGLVFGSAFHRALQCFYQGRLEGRAVGQAEMLQTFDRHWQEEEQEIRFARNQTREKLRQTAERMVEAFLEQAAPGQVIAVEEPFECHLAHGTPPLVGYIDLVEVRKDDQGERLHLTDFKTAARKPSGPEDLDPDQLTLYAIAAHRTGLLKEFELEFALDYMALTKTKTPEVARIPIEPDRHEALRLIEKARICWQGMAAGVCFPSPGWMCSGCGYRQLCRQWPHLPEPEGGEAHA